MLQIARFGAIAICDSNLESQITSDLKGSGAGARPPPRGGPRTTTLARFGGLGSCLRHGASCLLYCMATCNGHDPVCYRVLSFFQIIRVG